MASLLRLVRLASARKRADEPEREIVASVGCGCVPCDHLALSNFPWGVNMNRLFLILAVAAATSSLLLSNPTSAQFVPAAKKAARVRIIKGPDLELARENLTIITWTSNNPGGSPEHFGVVHYGTDPKNLSQTAKSHIRLNPTHSYTVFRVRVEGLVPKTTYYYKVDSMEPNGKSDGVTSPIKTFTTQ
jgi:phosphodiesterase/alkaline phosphatase D-like protein